MVTIMYFFEIKGMSNNAAGKGIPGILCLNIAGMENSRRMDGE